MESILYDSKNSQTYKFGLQVLDFVPKDDSLSIIDIGSGSGALTLELSHRAGVVIGIDNNLKTVSDAQKRYPTVPFYLMDATRLQYENRFDIAFSNATMHEIKDKRKAFTSIYKSLKKGGKLIAEFASAGSTSVYFDIFDAELKKRGLGEDAKTFFLIDVDECKEMLEDIGFTIKLLEEHSRKTYVRGEDENQHNYIDATISRSLDEDLRRELHDSLYNAMLEQCKGPRGCAREITRIRVIATKE